MTHRGGNGRGVTPPPPLSLSNRPFFLELAPYHRFDLRTQTLVFKSLCDVVRMAVVIWEEMEMNRSLKNEDGERAETRLWLRLHSTVLLFYLFTSLASCTVLNNQPLICFCFTLVCKRMHLCVAHTLIAYQPQALLYRLISVVGSSKFSVCVPKRTSQCLYSHSEKSQIHSDMDLWSESIQI